MRKFLFILIILQFCACMPKINSDHALESLVEAERSFAKASVEKGIRDAFLLYLADNAIVFRPKPVKAKPLYEQQPQIPGSLNWKPIHADIAASGDFGYTTGPFEYRKNMENEKADGCGFYVSVWQKQIDDKWKVLIDGGINCPCPDTTFPEIILDKQKYRFIYKSKLKIDLETEKTKLLGRDEDFSSQVARQGIVDAYRVFSSDDIRYYRMGEFPTIGKETVCKKLKDHAGTMFWKPMASNVAESGDFGYTYGLMYGTSENGEQQSSSYLRIWKKAAAEWRVVLDLMNPIPEESKNPDE